MDEIDIYTDGACSGNPGPGGWGALLTYGGEERELFGGESSTTNNRMELTAVIEALAALKRPSRVVLHTDSQYVQKGITEWIRGWKAKGWRTASRAPVKNVDLWKRLDERDKAFCAGASFDELVAIEDGTRGLEFFSGFAHVINAIRTVPVFVIGRIHSLCVGGGVGIACAVDIAYATTNATIRLSELAVGIGPFVVGPAVERKVGTGHFGLLSATPATKRSAQWAEQHGIYAELFDSTEALDARVEAHARELAAYSPEAMADIKRVLWKGTEDWDQLLIGRAKISGRLVLSDFTRNAIAAFKEAAAKR